MRARSTAAPIIIQPVIAPLYSSRSVHQIADMLLGTADPPADSAVRATWRDDIRRRLRRSAGRRALHDGFVAGSAAQAADAVSQAVPPPETHAAPPAADSTSCSGPIRPIWDGRFGNIAWLQELPKPLTKITWDNVIAISPAIAAAKGLSNGDIAEVTIGERTVRGAAWIVPGQAPKTIALFFGYGRRAGGDIATGSGYDAFAVRPGERPVFGARRHRARGRPSTRSRRRRLITAWTASTSCAR